MLMPDPHDTLSIFAEVSIALAGFSGIAIALGRRALGSITALESRRLFNLFAFSGLVLFSSLLSIALLHFQSVSPSILWASGSVIMLLLGCPWIILDWRKISKLTPLERAKVNPFVIYPFTILAVLFLLLQLFNALWIKEAWPFFLVLVLALTFAFQQFVLLVYMAINEA